MLIFDASLRAAGTAAGMGYNLTSHARNSRGGSRVTILVLASLTGPLFIPLEVVRSANGNVPTKYEVLN